MWTRASIISVLALTTLSLACDDSSDDPEPTLQRGQFCDVSFPEDCPDKLCRDAVGGESCDNISCSDWSQASNQGTICTQACSSDEDCTGIDFATAAQEQVSSEEWFCSGGVCNVLVTPPPGQQGDLCTGCGGAFCSGRCIGCPQC